MKTPLPQIAFDFAPAINAPQEEPSVESPLLSAIPEPPAAGKPLPSVEETTPSPDNVVVMPHASVGVRLKHMKGQNVEPPSTVSPATADAGIMVSFIEPLDPQEGEAAVVAPREGKSTRGRKSLKQVAAEADLIEIPADEELFSKQYYTMGEVAGMFRVNQSLLRFWEAEFNILQPRKNKKGDRYFRPVDIKNLHLIYHLLRQRKYTIEGAREFLKNHKKAEQKFEAIRRMKDIKAFLLELKAQL